MGFREKIKLINENVNDYEIILTELSACYSCPCGIKSTVGTEQSSAERIRIVVQQSDFIMSDIIILEVFFNQLIYNFF